MNKELKYTIFWMILMLQGIGSSYADTRSLADKLSLGTATEFKLCSGAKEGEELTVYNNSDMNAFKPGSVKINWGDGSAEEVWTTGETSKKHMYTMFGILKLTMSAVGTDGTAVNKEYKVIHLGEPVVIFGKGESGYSCVNAETLIKIGDFETHTPGTKYTVDFGDGRNQVFTQDELVAKGGLLKHVYLKSNCPHGLEIRLTVSNECVNLPYITSFGTFAVTPPIADFIVPQNNCTGTPVFFVNTTVAGYNASCGSETNFQWIFEGGSPSSSTDRLPPNGVIYDKPGIYDVTLMTNNGPACSKGQVVQKIEVIESVKAKFTIAGDTLCAGDNMLFENISTGGNKRYKWTVSGTPFNDHAFITPTTPESADANIRFNNYGTYHVTLKVSNDCSESTIDTTIIVKKDPEVLLNPVEPICPDVLLDLSRFTSYTWNGNNPVVKWKIYRIDGVDGGYTYDPGYGADKEFPKVKFQFPGIYRIEAQLKSAGCMGDKLKAVQSMEVYDKTIIQDFAGIPAEICSGDEIAFTNNSRGVNINFKWTVTPEAGVNMTPAKSVERSPVLKFTQCGIYTVKVRLIGQCKEDMAEFKIKVKKNPTVVLGDLNGICPPGVLNFKTLPNAVNYEWNCNAENATWEILPNDGGYTYINGTTANDAWPQIKFTKPQNYTLKVKLENTGCGSTFLLESQKEMKVYNTAMTVDMTPDQTTVCEGEKVKFNNNSTGDEPEFRWRITPAEGWEFYLSDSTSASPLVQFNKFGVYSVRGMIKTPCGSDERIMQITVKRDPEVKLHDFDSLCPGLIDLAHYTELKMNGNNVQHALWEFSPSSDVILEQGSALTDLFPKISFRRPGDYTMKINLNEYLNCGGTDLIATRSFKVLDSTILVDVLPDRTEICENNSVKFVNNTAGGSPLAYQWSVDQADGYAFAGGDAARNQKNAEITFSRHGTYVVRLKIRGSCGEREKIFTITVRGIPVITVKDTIKDMCINGQVKMADYISYDKKGSTMVPSWTVTPADGITFDPNVELPEILFGGSGNRIIRMHGTTGCGNVEFEDRIFVLSSTIKAIASSDAAAGCVDFTVPLKNLSLGDQLEYKWTVSPANGYLLMQEKEKVPSLEIRNRGEYNIKLQVNNICGSDDTVFSVKAYTKPEIIPVADINGVCEPYVFKGKEMVTIKENGDKLTYVKWEIDKSAGIDYSFVNGTKDTSRMPDIEFQNGIYQVKGEVRNGCPESVSATFRVSVDEFVPIDPIKNDTLCLFESPLLLTATPAGGFWTLPDHPEMLKKEGDNWMFHPLSAGDYELTYNRSNGSCTATGIKKIRIHPLPVVDAGVDPRMCINDAPQLLQAVPTGGYWVYDGGILAADRFTAVTAGDFKLKYYYTDGNGCINADSSVMTVHPLPETAFETAQKHCRYAPALFQPIQTDGNRFEWDFGDGTPAGISRGDTAHIYDKYGDFTVNAVVTSKYGCVAYAVPRPVEVLNLPPAAFFDVDTLSGCAPFQVKISIDPSKYVSDHNDLSFRWDYGDGIVTDTLMPIFPKTYPSGVWDTTYTTRFIVTNMCGTQEYDTVITVNSVPVASFRLRHNWECSPVDVKIQNTSTGNRCSFLWDFGDGSPVTDVRDPVHLFTTGNKPSKYYITLTATNNCKGDIHKDSLLVKPRTLSAHFSSAKPYACVGEELCFENNSMDTLSSILNTYWNFGDGARDSLWNACHKYNSEGSYTVSLFIENGCGFDTISERLTIHPLPVLSISGQEHLCEADTFTFVLRSDQELKNIRWDFGDGNVANERDSLRYVYKGYGKHTISVRGISAKIGSCVSETTKDIEVYNKPIVSIFPVDTAVCSPFLFKPHVAGEGFFMWDWDDGKEMDSAREHLFVNTSDTVQNYNIVAYVETDKGCKTDFKRKLKLYNRPRAILGKEVTTGNPQKVLFKNLSEEFTDCIWEIPFRKPFHSPDDQEVIFGKNGAYSASLTAVNYWGCCDTTELEHEVVIKGLYFPNTFIPHSANDKINNFNAIAIGLREYHLEIFDTYGNKVWETKALTDGIPSEGWNGCDRNGKPLPQGVYIWRAKAIFIDDEVWTGRNDSGAGQTTQGTVMLLRK